jgi:uncharacterized cofD-like protein
MTQPGESDDYGVDDHIRAINRHAKGKVIDYVLVNTGVISSELERKYHNDNSNMVTINEEEIKKLGIGVIKSDFVKIGKGYIRHDTDKLATILVETIMDKKLFNDKKKIVEYFYLSQRLKENKNK